MNDNTENTTNAMSNDINESDSYSDGVPVAQPINVETIEDNLKTVTLTLMLPMQLMRGICHCRIHSTLIKHRL